MPKPRKSLVSLDATPSYHRVLYSLDLLMFRATLLPSVFPILLPRRAASMGSAISSPRSLSASPGWRRLFCATPLESRPRSGQ